MIAQNYTVTAVEETTVAATPCWHVTFQRADGGTYAQVFPAAALEWRAAEYEIDPTDTELLLDIVLHEPFIPDPTEPVHFAEDAAAKRGMTVPAREARSPVQVGDPEPVWLYNAPSVEQARTAHLERVAAVKRDRVRITDAGPSGGRAAEGGAGLLTAILARGVDPEGVAAKAKMVEQFRAGFSDGVG